MDEGQKRMYDPGEAPVYPLPQRDPMRSLADWGAPPSQPDRLDRPPVDSEEAYVSPGPPPWVASRPRGLPKWAVAAIVLGALLVACAGCVGLSLVSGGEKDPAALTAPIETQGELQTTVVPSTATVTPSLEKPTVNRIGQRVRSGDFEYVVHKVKCGISRAGDQYLNKRAQGSFCRVDVTAKNMTKSAQTFHADSVLKAQDSTGREFSPDGTANIYGNKDSAGFLNEINPGNSVRAFVYFDVPKGAKLVRLELSAGLFTLAQDAVVELA